MHSRPRLHPSIKPQTMKTSNITFVLLFLLGTATSLLAQHTFTGTVTGPQGQPLPGVNVTFDYVTPGTVTDLNGRFALNHNKPCTNLIFEAPGYMTEVQKQVCATDSILVTMISRPQRELVEEEAMEAYPASPVMSDQMIRTSGQHKMRGGNRGIVPGYAMDPGTPHNTEDYAAIQENRFHRPGDEPLSTFSIDVDAAAYSNMRRFLKNGQQPPIDAIRVEELVNYFNYDYPQPTDEHPFHIETELAECPWQPDHQLLHIGLQGTLIPNDDLPSTNLVFLVDVSGSMQAANKLPLLQSSLQLLTDQLRPQDRVALVVYAGAAGTVLESTPGSEKMKIKDAIRSLTAGGSTAGGEGIKLAYKIAREHFQKEGNNRVILATDGDFNVGESSDAAMQRLIEKERESGVFLTVLGFGMGNYKDNKMQILADKGNGNHAYIDDLSEARKVLVNEFGGTLFTIAKDVKIQIEFNPAKVAGYRLIGYENRLLNKEDFNDDKVDAGELGSGHTVTALYEIIPTGVESDFLAGVDDLKYQQPKPSGKKSDDLATVKFRYKKPDGEQSILLERTILAKANKKASESFRWSAAVASFGMVLRDSEFKGNANYDAIIELARSSQGDDPEGYRAEFIRLVKNARDLFPSKDKEDDTTAGNR